MDSQSQVAYASNILAMEGHTDTIYGHVSARVEGAAQVWMKPATLGLEEVRPVRPGSLAAQVGRADRRLAGTV